MTTALLVVDVQNDVMAGAPNRDEVVANLVTLVDKARAADVPVVWVQHSDKGMPIGSDGWKYVPELVLADTDPVIHKKHGDSFDQTDLSEVLTARDITHLVVAGAQSDACIRSTLHGAITRGYDTTLVTDAHTTEDLSQWGGPPVETAISFTNFYWENHSSGTAKAAIITTAELAF